MTIVNGDVNYCVVAAVQADAVFEALADSNRRLVVQLLSSGPRRAGDLAAVTGLTSPAMSRHLRLLLAAGVVSDARAPGDARVRMFSLRPESMAPVQAWLDQVQAHWSEQLASFKRHVEDKAVHAQTRESS